MWQWTEWWVGWCECSIFGRVVFSCKQKANYVHRWAIIHSYGSSLSSLFFSFTTHATLTTYFPVWNTINIEKLLKRMESGRCAIWFVHAHCICLRLSLFLFSCAKIHFDTVLQSSLSLSFVDGEFKPNRFDFLSLCVVKQFALLWFVWQNYFTYCSL